MPFSKGREMAKRHGAEYWRRHLEAWHQSDLTQKAYCASQGLSVESLRRWRRREKEMLAAAQASLTLVPVSLGKADSASIVRLRSPGGWEIELPGSSVPLLVGVLKELSESRDRPNARQFRPCAGCCARGARHGTCRASVQRTLYCLTSRLEVWVPRAEATMNRSRC